MKTQAVVFIGSGAELTRKLALTGLTPAKFYFVVFMPNADSDAVYQSDPYDTEDQAEAAYEQLFRQRPKQ